MALHFSCLNMTKNPGVMELLDDITVTTDQQTLEECTDWKPRYKIVLSTSVSSWLICFPRPEFCWFGFLVIEVLRTSKSPGGPGRWLNHRVNSQQIQLLGSTLCLEKKVAKLRHEPFQIMRPVQPNHACQRAFKKAERGKSGFKRSSGHGIEETQEKSRA